MSFYYSFEAFFGIFELVNVAVVCIASAFIIAALLKHKKDRAPIFLWAIDLKKSTSQMKILFLSAIIFVAVLAAYVIGEFYSFLYLIIAAQAIGMISYIMISYVVIIWFKEFIRFV